MKTFKYLVIFSLKFNKIFFNYSVGHVDMEGLKSQAKNVVDVLTDIFLVESQPVDRQNAFVDICSSTEF
jgi:hypothetical protein